MREESSLGIFDAVFIAAGPIGQASIIQKSLNSRELFTNETPISIVPAIFFGKMRKQPQSMNRISFSELFMFYLSRKGKIVSAAQVYSLNLQLLENLGRLKSFIPKIFRSRGLVFMWFDKSGEDSFVPLLNHKGSSRRAFNSLKLTRFLGYFSFALTNLSLKVFVSPFNILKGKKGTSYHFGGLFELSKDGREYVRLIRKDGSIIGAEHPNVFVVGSAQLDEPFPGPVTFMIMAMAHAATRKYLTK
jgi:hypothetical protein